MIEPQPSTPAAAPVEPTPSGAPLPIKRRRRWIWWLSTILILALAAVFALPYLAAVPAIRDQALKWLSARTNLQITAKELSLDWFSPIAVGDISVQNDDSHQAVLAIKRIESDTALWRLLMGHDAGNFRIVQPQLNIEFDKGGWNLARLLQAMASAALMNKRAIRWEIVDASLSLRGPSSTRPLVVEQLNLRGATIPATDNPLGVPVLHGGAIQLLHETQLTPQLCNDLLKFIAPVLSQTTSASGRVSLELDQFYWPLGIPDKADVKGKLTLHSVEVGPGGFVKLLADLMQLKDVPAAMQIAKDDVVAFHLHDGRVFHENLNFSLTALKDKPTIRSHGSVGLDETLDLDIDISALATGLPADSFLHSLLSQATLHVVGTLSSPKLAAPGLKQLTDWFQQRRSEKRDDSSRPGLLPGRRGANGNPPPSPPPAP